MFPGNYDLATLQSGAVVGITLNATSTRGWSVVSVVAAGTVVLIANQAVFGPVAIPVYAKITSSGGLLWATSGTITSLSKVLLCVGGRLPCVCLPTLPVKSAICALSFATCTVIDSTRQRSLCVGLGK